MIKRIYEASHSKKGALGTGAFQLTQVLADGTNTYLYGLGRIGQYSETEILGLPDPITGLPQVELLETWSYYLPDALGSARQLTDADGAVTLAQSFEPYGETLGAFGNQVTSYGFAGEQTDATGLQYLRARYYAPEQGRFVSRDAWTGDVTNPLSLNRWAYVEANPINKTDPSGYATTPPPPNHRDLTNWLLREMRSNSNSPQVQEIRSLITLSQQIENISKGESYQTRLGGFVLSKLIWGMAAFEWKGMVEDGARWDFKDQIEDNLGRSITLCASGNCRWYEFSTPGNIHYGYVGRAAGFSLSMLHNGASYAEITDPAHRELTELMGQWYVNLHENFLICSSVVANMDIYVNLEWWESRFDDPTDYAAIDLGSQAYTTGNFSASLHAYSSRLMSAKSPAGSYSNPAWPYPLGYFNGGN